MINKIFNMSNPITNYINKRKGDKRSSMIIDNFDMSKISFDEQSESNSLVETNIKRFEGSMPIKSIQYKKEHKNTHVCEICNSVNSNNNFIILNCGHIYHINCLVECHYENLDKYAVIDEHFIDSCVCLMCHERMELEDISHIHNKFLKTTKICLTKQQENIDLVDKQMEKLKDELRTLMEYKQRLEHQKERSKQITISINLHN
jgi:hypothetical protein